MRNFAKSGWGKVLSLGVALPLLLAACATPPPPAPPPIARDKALPFKDAVHVAVSDLFAQTQAKAQALAAAQANAFTPLLAKMNNAKPVRATVVMDTLIDAVTGQQTVATYQAEAIAQEWVAQQFAQYEILPLQSSNVLNAQYLLTGALQKESVSNGGFSRLSLALVDLKTKQVGAQTTIRVIDLGLDMNPTAYYRDSPVLMRDQIVDGHIKTAQSATGSAADIRYLDRLVTSALLSEAIVAYNGNKYSEALELYKSAAARPDGQQMRIFNGLYLSNTKLGRTNDAELAFGKIVNLGLTSNSLGVKFLFRPGSTDFWSDTKVSGPYEFWLRQIAKQAAATGSCMNIIGHTSKTGSEEFNNRLALQRATYIRGRLEADAPTLKKRLRESGMGFRENIIGTGSDDVRDSLDRRVEFKVTPCDK